MPPSGIEMEQLGASLLATPSRTPAAGIYASFSLKKAIVRPQARSAASLS